MILLTPRRACAALLLAIASTILAPAAAGAADAPRRPNILLIVADDLGYSDLGAFGGEIATPNLDALAAQGLRLLDFYVSPACSPTRAMLLSGTNNHVAGLGNMAELMLPEQRRRPGYEGHLNDRVLAFPVLLRDAGYHTYMVGKWHLGLTEELSPAARGFERSYSLSEGGAGHYDQTGTSPRVPRATYREDGRQVDLPAQGFYSTDFFTDRLIRYIDADRGDGRPFFAYAAYTAPHWPLQAPDELIRKYEDTYRVGYDAIRQARLRRMRQLGLVRDEADFHPGSPVWPRWEQLTGRQRAEEVRRMAAYAAMVESLDQNVGRLLAHLRETGLYDDTLILFMSDNGAEGSRPPPDWMPWITATFDNRLENIGRPGSFVAPGPNWAQVSSTPLRLYKAFMYEGGIASPAIIVGPRLARRGQSSGAPATVMDIAPTLLEAAGVRHPGTEYRGRGIAPMTGASLLPYLTGDAASPHPADHVFVMELVGRVAVRRGTWKLVRSNPPWGSGGWELYDLARDRAERHDLAAQHPGIVRELLAAWDRYRQEHGVIWSEDTAGRIGYANDTSFE